MSNPEADSLLLSRLQQGIAFARSQTTGPNYALEIVPLGVQIRASCSFENNLLLNVQPVTWADLTSTGKGNPLIMAIESARDGLEHELKQRFQPAERSR